MHDGSKLPSTPKNGWPKDYHDYVFRNGKLVGDFDNMYRYAEGVPWNQDKPTQFWSLEVGMLMLKDRAPYESILEIGCGLGYIAAKLKSLAGPGGVDAFDISSEAIQRARKLHEGIHFYVDDATQAAFRPRRQYDLVVVRSLIWYVFDRIDQVIRNIAACVKPQGFLYLGQPFPRLDEPFVGKKALPTPEVLLSRLTDYRPLYTAYLHNHELTKDGPTLHFVGIKKG